MDVLERIGNAGLVPVVVIDDAADAVSSAQALLAADLDIMEITMRTDAGIQAIKNVRKACPDMLVGAGTVLSAEKAAEAVAAGAQFIVTPGFNPPVVKWCVENNIPITPGCVTPTEIDMALSYGIKVLKFFPADVYGGVKGCSALYGPYKVAGVSFIPTGGVNNDNLAEFADKPFIHAVGGGWLCNTADIKSHNFEAITSSVKKAVAILLGFEFAHLGINAPTPENALNIAEDFENAFNFPIKQGSGSNFAGTGIEITKSIGLGQCGHIAVRTNNIKRAIHYLGKKGYTADMNTAKFSGDKMIAVYFTKEFGGFAVHLLQK
ncbi:MAG: bifunctional 4-hydroxy-2-oxoglutarate aldolase/2-dehydro-3-deoxy-phosphogluconate aldolase [Christensenellales bacterium]